MVGCIDWDVMVIIVVGLFLCVWSTYDGSTIYYKVKTIDNKQLGKSSVLTNMIHFQSANP